MFFGSAGSCSSQCGDSWSVLADLFERPPSTSPDSLISRSAIHHGDSGHAETITCNACPKRSRQPANVDKQKVYPHRFPIDMTNVAKTRSCLIISPIRGDLSNYRAVSSLCSVINLYSTLLPTSAGSTALFVHVRHKQQQANIPVGMKKVTMRPIICHGRSRNLRHRPRNKCAANRCSSCDPLLR
jgi:hypothetical protein